MALCLLCGGGSLPGCTAPASATGDAATTAPPPSAPNPVKLSGRRVEVARLESSAASLEIRVPGEVQGHRDALLAAALGGYIESVKVAEGATVAQGKILALVDSEAHRRRLARAQIDLNSAERELARAESLQGAIPTAELDAARDRVSMAGAARDELALNAERAVLRAPFSGVVTSVNAEVGEVAMPGAPLMRLVQLSPINVSLSLSDRDLALARVGAPATVTLDARASQFQGTVKRIAQAADPSTRSFEAIVELPNDDRQLLPGMIARVTLQTDPPAAGAGEASGRIVISQDWAVTLRDGVGVFVVEGGTARFRMVQLGSILRKQVVVEKGLSVGDLLVVSGQRDLVDGDEVLVQRTGICCNRGRVTF